MESAPEPWFDCALLERYKPRFCLDSQEGFQQLAAESMTDNPGNVLADASGRTIARAGAGGELGLTTLEEYPDDRSILKTDELRHGDGRLVDSVRMTLGEAGDAYPTRVYGQIVDHDGYRWLQYWSWHYHNPKRIVGFGSHEGDWELVQIGLDSEGRPRKVTFAQHNGGESKDWQHVERVGETHVVVYVALFSHAAYFEAGTQAYAARFLADNADGKGPEVDPVLEQFNGWASWPGRWGKGTAAGRRFGGKLGHLGPESPRCQESRSLTPGNFHDGGRSRPPRERRVLWNLGKRTYPLKPRSLQVREVRGDAVRVNYRLPRTRLGRRLLITIHDPRRQGSQLIGTRWVGWPESDSFAFVPLIVRPVSREILVRASTFNMIDQRSVMVEQPASLDL